jgi:capsid protein
MGRHVAYWVSQKGHVEALARVGREVWAPPSWLVYGTDKRFDHVRGKPILSLVLQSLKEIDRYRDSTQRKALVLSMLAMFVAKGETSLALGRSPWRTVRRARSRARQTPGDRAVPHGGAGPWAGRSRSSAR